MDIIIFLKILIEFTTYINIDLSSLTLTLFLKFLINLRFALKSRYKFELSYRYGHLNFYFELKFMSILTRFHRYTFARVYKNFVNGEFVEAKDAQKFAVKNPVTQELLGWVPQTSQ